MIRLLIAASIRIHNVMRRYLPSNIVLDRIRTRAGLKWGLPTMLLALPYLGVAYWCTAVTSDGGPGWLNLVVLVCVWDSFKMLWIGPVSLTLLLRGRMREHRAAGAIDPRDHDVPVPSVVA